MLLALLALPLSACNFNAGANKARGCASCPTGQCYLGYCLSQPVPGDASVAGANAGQGANQGGSSGGVAPGGPGTGGTPAVGVSGASGAAGTSNGTGGGSAGRGTTPMCAPGAVASDEICNGVDDDCDGVIDEDISLGSCTAPGQGACATGALHCEHGVATCVANADPAPEVCNGLDDDCDGVVDNDIKTTCYPAGVAGCTHQSDGSFVCVGACGAGTQSCQNGKLQPCTGFVQPSAEVCGGTQAADEDCDGAIDNGCPCSTNQTQACYPGFALNLFSNHCRAGMQHCMGGRFGPCEGAITPGTETCANQGVDDDCNLVTDDVPNLNVACTNAANQGVCRKGMSACSGGRLACITPAAQSSETSCDGLDEDCDGKVDENFDLATDEANCGGCGIACSANQRCCDRGCRNIDSDPQYCGSCGMTCTGGTSCCAGSCISTDTHDHCGGCGACAADQACCGGACMPTNTHDHCGGCAACPGDQACCGGTCAVANTDGCGACGCGPNQACCGGSCTPTGTNDHCSGCAGCGTAETCCGGHCSDLQTDGAHCGSCQIACGNACSCVTGECRDSGGLACQ